MHTARNDIRLAVAAMVLALAGCVTHAPPTLTLDGRACADRPDLAAARSLALDSEIGVSIDDKTPCVTRDDGARTILVAFRLPVAPESYVVSVTSQPQGSALFSPHLTLLDRDGRPVRQIDRESLVNRGRSLSAAFRSRPGEVYLLISSDPARVGARADQFISSTQSTMVFTGVGYFFIHTGNEQVIPVTGSHSGFITVAARPVPTIP
jgi:Maltose operon periplasmic protein precursor (MalM)